MATIFSYILDLLFPGRCLECGKTLEGGACLCGECFARISYSCDIRCLRCFARLPYGVHTCHKDEPCTLIAALPYDAALPRALVGALKFNGVQTAASPLSDLMVLSARATKADFAAFSVVPVPLSKSRERRRGYNQAERLARNIAHKMELPLRMDILRRIRATAAQTTLENRAARLKNVEGCFRAKGLCPEKILLIDDVSTTGATLRSAARALKAAGARTVVALVAARA